MALKDADIAELKAAIPARFQPQDLTGGDLSANFASQGAMLAPSTLQGSDELNRLNMGLAFIGSADDDAAPGFMLSGALATIRAAHISHTEERKREDEQRFVLDQLRAQLDERLAALNAELAQIDERLEKISQRRIELGEGLEALDELDRLAATGQLNPDDPAHAALLRRAGIDPEDARRKDMNDIIAERRRDMSREDGALEGEWNKKMKRRGEVIRERDEVQAARAEIENADTPEAMEKAEQRARSVLGAQQLGEAAHQTQNHAAKVIAADAVAANEAPSRQDDSQTYNREAVSKDAQAVLAENDTEFELDAPAIKPVAPSPA